MKTISLKEFFEQVKYDWTKDKDIIETICYYTKTRAKDPDAPFLSRGCEQTFALKALAEWMKATSVFEIGTGRGTGCYALSLAPSMETIHTVDILNYTQKFATAIGNAPAVVSLEDIYNMVPVETKYKINFHTRVRLNDLRKTLKGTCDFAFIDGDHSKVSVITEDYEASKDIIKEDGIIIWDDYSPNTFSVKQVVENVLDKNPEYDAILLEQGGHLFDGGSPPEVGGGMVLMRKGKVF